MEYKIVTAQGKPQTLEAAVNTAIAEGWDVTGGVCATMHQGSGAVSYYQAMVREFASGGVLEFKLLQHSDAGPLVVTPAVAVPVFTVPDLSEAATVGAIEFAAETLGADYESILLDLYAHLGRKVNKADVREIPQVGEVIHAD